MLARVQEAQNADRASASLTLPVMSFEITTMAYDGDRKLTTTGRSSFINTGSPSTLKYQYNPVPYNVGFSLYIWVKNAEDGTKIVEQILPYFTPDFTVTVIMIPELNVKAEVPIIMNSISQNDAYEGDLKEHQAIIWTLNFTVKGNFYGPIKTAPLILFSNTNYRVADPGLPIHQANTTNSPLAEWTSIYPGQDANGNPTSNASITVPANTILATSDFGYITTNGVVFTEAHLLTVDKENYTADSTLISVDQQNVHEYVT